MTAKPMSFSYSWGSGYVAEEAKVEGEYHVPTLQLLKYTDGEAEYVYFGNPFPMVRVLATPDHLRDLSKYEAYTCLKKNSRADSIEIDRKDGALPRLS